MLNKYFPSVSLMKPTETLFPPAGINLIASKNSLIMRKFLVNLMK